jgi:hypothetical protein
MLTDTCGIGSQSPTLDISHGWVLRGYASSWIANRLDHPQQPNKRVESIFARFCVAKTMLDIGHHVRLKHNAIAFTPEKDRPCLAPASLASAFPETARETEVAVGLSGVSLEDYDSSRR